MAIQAPTVATTNFRASCVDIEMHGPCPLSTSMSPWQQRSAPGPWPRGQVHPSLPRCGPQPCRLVPGASLIRRRRRRSQGRWATANFATAVCRRSPRRSAHTDPPAISNPPICFELGRGDGPSIGPLHSVLCPSGIPPREPTLGWRGRYDAANVVGPPIIGSVDNLLIRICGILAVRFGVLGHSLFRRI